MPPLTITANPPPIPIGHHIMIGKVLVKLVINADYNDGLLDMVVVMVMMLVVPHQLALREHQRGLGINLLRA